MVSSKNIIFKGISANKSILFKHFFFTLFLILIVSIIVTISVQFINFTNDPSLQFEKVTLYDVQNLPEVKLVVRSDSDATYQRNVNCTHWDCFNIYKCGHTGQNRIAVYIYPLTKYVDQNAVPITEPISREFFSLLKAVVKSKYYTSNPDEACIFIPSIDTLNQDRLRLNLTSQALHSLPYWNNGENHLVFNMIAGTSPESTSAIELGLGNALLAGAEFNTYNFRPRFDISIPVFSPFSKYAELGDIQNGRSWLVSSTQLGLDPIYVEELEKISYHTESLLVLDGCPNGNYYKRCDISNGKQYNYIDILQDSTFCLIFRGEHMGQFALHEAMAANCIPVIVIDGIVMPFNNVIDWNRAAVFIMEDYLSTLIDVLMNVTHSRLQQMKYTVKHIYDNYMSSMEKITLTTLDVIQDRVYPHFSKVYEVWNLRPQERNLNPLFLPLTAPKSQGFTAVILTYDRVESLFTLIERLSKVPSLMNVVVVWNNQDKSPPPINMFPKIIKPIKIIPTDANKLSNRYYPYKDIETEAILHIDDDIVMLTADEIEFGYEVWREFPDRIVGFPSRIHVWDNVTNSWKYESEWTNEISMVLTGAAFLHKYWSFLYTTSMPDEVKNWVDEHMNCEDIAMNFLVANVTRKPPIKVTPRKKFKCPECASNEMLSADLGHMVERSHCVDRFAVAFGKMPLKSVEFRADPVLFKDPFPEKLKRFNEIGSL